MKENIIKGVMTEILETKDKKSAFEVFLHGEDLNLSVLSDNSKLGQIRNQVFTQYKNAKEVYKELTTDPKNIELFTKIRDLEVQISQARSILGSTVKLSMINQKRGGSETSYIIARASFYNPDNVKAEIRVYLGKTEEIGRSIEELSRDIKYMENAELQIVEAMNEVLVKNKVEIAIKKSVKIRQLVGAGSGIIQEVEEVIENKQPIKSPYRPGKKSNHKPKGYKFLG